MLNIQISSDEEMCFNDVSLSSYCYNAVFSALQRSWISEGKNFYPDEPITRKHAAIVIARVLGYGDIAGDLEKSAASLGIIACRAIGTVGMGLALYDAVERSKANSRHQAQKQTADYLEKTYFNSRTIDNISTTQNKIRAKTFDLQTKNPLPTLWGKIKGVFLQNLYVNSIKIHSKLYL